MLIFLPFVSIRNFRFYCYQYGTHRYPVPIKYFGGHFRLMEQNSEPSKLLGHKVRTLFDKILGQHVERLIGSRYGIGLLPLNVATIACLTLLSKREIDIKGTTSGTLKRYTEKTFLKELAGVGIDLSEDLTSVLKVMIQKGYIDVEPNGRFSAKKPAISMTRLFDLIFPKMPGLNFFAYLVQTIDEVLSGRKELKSAISQFDQTLQLHGVPLSKRISQPKSEQRPAQTFPKKEETPPQPTLVSLPDVIASSPGQQIKTFQFKELSVVRTDIEIPKTKLAQKKTRRKLYSEERPTTCAPPAKAEDTTAEPDLSTPKTSEEPSEFASHRPDAPHELPGNKPLEDTPADQSVPLLISENAKQELDVSTGSGIAEAEAKPDKIEKTDDVSPTVEPEYETEHDPETPSKEPEVVLTDEFIESRIAAFEEDLAAACPVCSTGRIQTQKTPAGKFFYVCSNKDCNLVSWGKPRHVVCPMCKNLFLIEAINTAGKTILKCPRATCRYWQNLPGEKTDTLPAETPSLSPPKPRRKVVRRRVLVRKKQ